MYIAERNRVLSHGVNNESNKNKIFDEEETIILLLIQVSVSKLVTTTSFVISL